MQNPVPVLCYHGTQVQNFTNIFSEGLKVPGHGNSLRVVNGSAYGLGIYLAISPQTSLGYVRGGSAMILCAALVGNR